MLLQYYLVFLLTIYCMGHSHNPKGHIKKDLKTFIKYYEGLSYDKHLLNERHRRAESAIRDEDKCVDLEFHAHGRKFRLHLRRDPSAFSQDFKIQGEATFEGLDVSHIYSGKLQDEANSFCHGSITDGHFEGFVQTNNGTFYIEPIRRYTEENTNYHSIIYHENDIDYSPLEESKNLSCAVKSLQQFLQHRTVDAVNRESPGMRSARSIDTSKTTCLLHLQTSYLYYKHFGSKEAATAQISTYIKAVNNIFQNTNFDGIRRINFRVKTLKILQEDDPSSPMSSPFIGPEKLLMLHSEANWNSYCLSYLLTDRDFSGVLGLAWEGRPGNHGGICSRYSKTTGGSMTSSNTGLITLQKYGQYLPPKLVHLVLAHELGHSLGAAHDEGERCMPSDTSLGNYLMYPYASEGNQPNNNKFSPCSIKSISNLLKVKKDICFQVSDLPICGNQIVDDWEECDVGDNDNDPCCYSATQPDELKCKRKPGMQCSPSQGVCCSHECDFKPSSQMCQRESECALKSFCSGMAPNCPAAAPKPNYTLCNMGTRICLNGFCDKSVCVKYGFEKCDCSSTSMEGKCQLCCQVPGNPETCTSTGSSTLQAYFNSTQVKLPPGSPCADKQGYCDRLGICRLVDADGPIARLKNFFLKLDKFEDIAEWMKSHWWAILIIIMTLAALMSSTVFLCGRTLDSDKEQGPKDDSRKVATKRGRTQIVMDNPWDEEDEKETRI
ncbi:disintegrin and metalloproteinase domain-containing protein 10-like [Protopterus annectens]|uniref:disintegrin and metalloproteinase domain-containing protein 10-like n=1 Tax=Protopterus annectens TaxID=7888 RepID=UPI001CFB2DC8|nr:disintegrin and metalloproteinase domain-containing protein 10-like [Protopterus annectens]